MPKNGGRIIVMIMDDSKCGCMSVCNSVTVTQYCDTYNHPADDVVKMFQSRNSATTRAPPLLYHCDLLSRVICFLYCGSQNLVCVAGSKSHPFPVRVGLCHGCPM